MPNTPSNTRGSSVNQPPGSSKWHDRLLAIIFVAAGLLAISGNHADVDLWGHVRYGQDTLDNGLHTKATYTFTAQNHTWINHENLAEILMAVGVGTFGAQGLLIAKTLMGLGVFLLLLRNAKQYGTSMVTAGLILLVVAMNLGDHWVLRPQLLSYFFYAILLSMLSYSFDGWQFQNRFVGFNKQRHKDPISLGYSSARMRRLWLIPALFLLWANSHGGFVAGLGVYICYLGVRSMEAVSCRGKPGWGIARRLTMMSFVGVLATFLNPYGLRLHHWLLRALGAARPEITEWHPPELVGWQAAPLWAALALFMFGLLFSRRSKDVTHIVVLMLIFWQSMAHQRHIPFFVLSLAFWMHPHIQSAFERFGFGKRDTQDTSAGVRWLVSAGLLFAATLLVMQLREQHKEVIVDRGEFPVGAVEYMARERLSGRAVVTYNWAQYVLAAFASETDESQSQVRVAFDGRFRTCYPQDVIDMHFDFVLGDLGPQFRHRDPESPAFDASRVLRHARPDLVLLRRSQHNSVATMKANERKWVLLYSDSVAQLWGRSRRYADRGSPYFIPPERRVLNDEPQTGSVSWPAFPQTESPASLADNR